MRRLTYEMVLDSAKDDFVGKFWMTKYFTADVVFSRVCDDDLALFDLHHAGRKACDELVVMVA